MLAKVIGILLLVVGGAMALLFLFHVIGSVLQLVFLVVKLAVPAILMYAGLRLLARESSR